jgi:hypothetical protein
MNRRQRAMTKKEMTKGVNKLYPARPEGCKQVLISCPFSPAKRDCKKCYYVTSGKVNLDKD